jgi:hypothetical protein
MADLPKQIQDQLRAAEQLELALHTPADPAPDNTPVDPPVAEPAPAPAPEPTPAPTPAPQASDEDQKYRVLKGKYDAEVPALHQQNRQLQAQLAQLSAQMAALQERSTPAEPTPAPQAQGASPKDIDDFGGDMVGMVERVARGVVADVANSVTAEFARLRSEIAALTGRAQLTASQQFDKDFNAAVPDWAEINAMPEWLEWLGQVDRMYGLTRQAMLNDAHAALDADRVAAIFDAFKATLPKPVETPPVVNTAKAELERQVAPSRASATANTTPPTQSVWTDAGIQQFYRDQALGKFKGREEEMNRIEADLNAAIAEGRYRPR